MKEKMTMLTPKTGRNDPCSCGSGKKYKKCCMDAENVSSKNVISVDLKWHKLRQLENTVVNCHITPYAKKELPTNAIKFAFMDCFPDPLPEDVDGEILFDYFFKSWFLLSWIPNDTFGLEQFDPKMTLAQNYLIRHNDRLNNQEKRFIEAVIDSYYSIYSIVDVELEKSLTVKDILLGTLHTVKEREGTRKLKPGSLIFGRILTLDDQSIFIGMAPFNMHPRYQGQLLDFRDSLIEDSAPNVLTPEALRSHLADRIRKNYFDIIINSCDKTFPLMENTDGERFQFIKSYFKLDISPEDAFNLLLPLTFEEDPEEFLEDAKKDKSGAIKQLQFPWIKLGNKLNDAWDNTILGHITLEKGRLILETNSHERAEKGKTRLSELLGNTVTFQQALIETAEQKIMNSPAPKSKSTKDKTESDLMALPEVQEKLKEMVKAHWKKWFDTPIPALKNKTPRDAATTQEGRERLEALFLKYQHNDSEKDNNLFKADIPYLKKTLGMDL